MPARSTWRGAVNIHFADTPIPIPVPVAIYTAVKSRRGESFKMLDPVNKMPVSQRLHAIDDTIVERSATLKGVEAGPGNWVAVEGDALSLIEGVGRSTKVEVERFADVDSIDFGRTIEHYVITPDEKVSGSDSSAVQVLWNGLRASRRAAIITNWAPRANSKPSILAITATENGLEGHLLAYEREYQTDVPSFTPDVREKIGEMFERAIRNYNLDDFDPSAYVDTHAERRQQAIDLALSGAPLGEALAASVQTATESPDLMAALEASLAAAAGPAEPAKPKRTRAKKVTEEVEA